MDMDKRIHLELRNRTPSDVSICQKYLCRSILLLCVMCACVFGGKALFYGGMLRGGVGFGVELQMNCKVGWGGDCNAIGACSGHRRRCPWCVTDYLCVCSRVCGYGCEGVRASVHPTGGRRGARVRVGGNAAISPSSELSAPTTRVWMEKMIEGRRRWAASWIKQQKGGVIF